MTVSLYRFRVVVHAVVISVFVVWARCETKGRPARRKLAKKVTAAIGRGEVAQTRFVRSAEGAAPSVTP